MKYLLIPLVIGGALFAFCRENPALAPAFNPALDARVELARTRDQLSETQKQLEAARSALAVAGKEQAERKRPAWFADRLQAANDLLAAPDAESAHGHRR